MQRGGIDSVGTKFIYLHYKEESHSKGKFLWKCDKKFFAAVLIGRGGGVKGKEVSHF